MIRQSHYDERLFHQSCSISSIKPQGSQDVGDGEISDSGCHNQESFDQIIRAIQVLSDNFGNGLKQLILIYLDSKTSSFSHLSAHEKSETDVKFELYKMENIALEQREMIIQQRDEIGTLKVQLSDTQKICSDQLEQIELTYKMKLEKYKNILSRLTLYFHDKNIISKIFNSMKRKLHEIRQRKLKEQNERLKVKLKQTQLQNESLVSKEVETEKDITHILNTQINGFKNKTFSCLIEKSIVKSKDISIFHKELVDKAVDTQTMPKWNLSPLKSKYFQKKVSPVALSRPIMSTKTISTLKYRTRTSQTLSPEDVLSIKPMNLQRGLLR